MAQLVVGGVTIPVAPGNASRDRDDFTDRRRAFDGTYRASQTGGAARTWRFRTPPITRVLADTYEATLGIVAAQMCSGDLLGIPTMCCAQIDSGWNAIKAASGHYVELPFTLHEVQPAKLLLKYAPGDTITGESFSRSTVASYVNGNLVVAVAAINEKRDQHRSGADVSVRGLLLEDARTNKVPYSDGWASWADTGVTIGATTTDPYGGSTAPLLTDAAGNNARAIAVSLTGDGTKAISIFVKKNGSNVPMVGLYDATAVLFRHRVTITWDGSGLPVVATESGAGTIFSYRSLAGGWFLIRFTANSAVAANSNFLYFYPSQNAPGSVYAMGAQVEDATFSSSYIFTTGAALTRTADSYSLPFTTPPQEMTVYAKFVEGGTILTGGGNIAGVVSIGALGGTEPTFLLYENGANKYSAYHGEGAAGAVQSAQAAAPSLGQTVELVGRLYGDGSVQSIQSINGAAETTATQTGVQALGAAWSDVLLHLNVFATTLKGFNAFQSIKIVAGARSLAEMRTL